jgi:hypothetical protein
MHSHCCYVTPGACSATRADLNLSAAGETLLSRAPEVHHHQFQAQMHLSPDPSASSAATGRRWWTSSSRRSSLVTDQLLLAEGCTAASAAATACFWLTAPPLALAAAMRVPHFHCLSSDPSTLSLIIWPFLFLFLFFFLSVSQLARPLYLSFLLSLYLLTLPLSTLWPFNLCLCVYQLTRSSSLSLYLTVTHSSDPLSADPSSLPVCLLAVPSSLSLC